MRRALPLLVLIACLVQGACGPSPVAAVPPPAPQGGGRVDLVESVPVETNLDHPDIPDAYQVWPEMIQGATRTLDLAEFYVSDEPGSRLEPVIAGHRGRRAIAAWPCACWPTRSSQAATPRRSTAWGPSPASPCAASTCTTVMGGVLHAKYFVVDGRETYLGSQNFDWRSLTHIQGMGVRIRDPAATAAYAQVFALDWDLAAGRLPRRPRRRASRLLPRCPRRLPAGARHGDARHEPAWLLPRPAHAGSCRASWRSSTAPSRASTCRCSRTRHEVARRLCVPRSRRRPAPRRGPRRGGLAARLRLGQEEGGRRGRSEAGAGAGGEGALHRRARRGRAASCPSRALPTPSTWWSTAHGRGWGRATGRATTSRRAATSGSSSRATRSRRSSTASSTTHSPGRTPRSWTPARAYEPPRVK